MHLDFWDLIKVGGAALWIIAAASVIALAVGLERLSALWRFGERARSLADTVNRCLLRGAVAEARAACERSKSPLADVFLVGFERMGRGSREALTAAVERERIRTLMALRTRLWILGTIGATAPFIGLFGTVVGIMNAFGTISASGQGGFAVVSKGISEALIATAAGLAVALEAVFIYNYFNQRLARLSTEMKLLIEEFLEALFDQGAVAQARPVAGVEPASDEPATVAATAEATRGVS